MQTNRLLTLAPLLLAAHVAWTNDDLANAAFTTMGVLFCLADVSALGYLLSWQGQAHSSRERRLRFRRRVLPALVLLLPALLLVAVRIMLLWAD